MLRTIYRMCNIDFDKIPGGIKIDCNKIVVSPAKEEEIMRKLEEEFDLTGLEAALVMLHYGPAVDENLDAEILIKQKDLPTYVKGYE